MNGFTDDEPPIMAAMIDNATQKRAMAAPVKRIDRQHAKGWKLIHSQRATATQSGR